MTSPRPRSGRLARSTAFFSAATALSRVAGLAREILAAGFFGVSRQMSAFTYAFAVPNLVRSLFADAAIQAAFVPVFTEKLEAGEKREAFRLAATLFYLIALVLALLTTLFILLAPVLMPLIAQGFGTAGDDLTIVLTQLLFPILVLLGITGMVVGVLNSYDRFGAMAIAPLFWNLAIIAVLVGFAPVVPRGRRIYLYAIGVLAGTVVQLDDCAYDLRNTPFRLLRRSIGARLRRDVRRVLLLMLPVTISLGLINFNLQINASSEADRPTCRLRPRSTRRFASTCCRRESSRSRWRPCCFRPWPGTRPGHTTTTCDPRWRTGCARSCCC